ncbi:MAG: GNAT family N-acetyltransferase [Phycisphaerae bacterium]|nr:GNAT family N-acetyltransferase [Phycisphaerae bacterium]
MRASNAEIIRQLTDHGADLVGFADVSCLPADVTGGLTRAVAIALALDPAVIRDIENGPTAEYFAEYERANALLAQLSEEVARTLVKSGSRARAFAPTSEQIDKATLSAKLQHRTVATRAGLGWIGKSGLLVTREYGSAVRLASVLTDAELEIGEPVDISSCGDCRRCVEHCPAKAIVGVNWETGATREHIYDAVSCFKTARSLSGAKGLQATICGVCIHACPWTQRYLARERKRPEIDIVPAPPEDFDAVRALFREYEASLPFDLSFQNFEQEWAELPGRYAPPSGQMLLAQCRGAFVGCVALRQIGEGVCEMKRLFVQPAFRGKGIGKALAKAIIEEGRRIGYKRMRLDTVCEPAKGLYRSLGFREIPPYQHVPIDGVVFMELEL